MFPKMQGFAMQIRDLTFREPIPSWDDDRMFFIIAKHLYAYNRPIAIKTLSPSRKGLKFEFVLKFWN